MVQRVEHLWSRCTQDFQSRVTDDDFKRWFVPLRACGLRQEDELALLTLETPHSYYRAFFDAYYRPTVQEHLTRVLGCPTYIRYVETSSPYHEADPAEDTNAWATSMAGMDGGSRKVLTSFTFDAFVEGDENALPRRAALSIAEQRSAVSFNPFLIYGGAGLGKTHLMQAIVNHVARARPEQRCAYVTSEQFTRDFVEAMKKNQMRALAGFYRQFDLLVIDDVQFLAGKQKTQEEFYQIFDALLYRGAQIVMCSDRPPTEIKGLEERLVSRFQSGLTAFIDPPRLDLRRRIVSSKAEALGLQVSDDILGFVATRCAGNVRLVEGALNTLLALQQLEGSVSPERARKVLGDRVGSATAQVTMEAISSQAARAYGISPAALYSRTRRRDTVEARQLAMYLSRQHTQHTLKRIGNHFRRDHTTVMHACNVVEERLHEPHFAGMVAKIERGLGETGATVVASPTPASRGPSRENRHARGDASVFRGRPA